MTRLQTIALATATLLTTTTMATAAEDSTTLAKRFESFNTVDMHRKAHGIIMSICFVVLFPAFALIIYLVPYSKRASRVHAPLQLTTLALAVAGFGLGIDVEREFALVNQHHTIIGTAVVSYLIVFQPLLGFLQHRYFVKHGEGSFFGLAHRWLGRAFLILGMINGGLGLQLARQLAGNAGATSGLEIAYGVVAGVMGTFYIAVVIVKSLLSGSSSESREKASNADLVSS